MSTLNTIGQVVVILLVGSALAWGLVSYCHGAYMDRVEGRFHEDCIMCDQYQWNMFDDPAFQLRELRRN